MFSFISKRAVFIVLLAAFLFTGCQPEPDDAGDLDGTWLLNSFPSYLIDTSAMTIEYIDNYKGTIVNNPDFTATNGLLIIRFEEYMRYEYDPADWSAPPVITENPEDVIGNYGALYWRELKSKSVKMADYWEVGADGYVHVIFENIEDAEDYFTMSAALNIDWGITTPYTK